MTTYDVINTDTVLSRLFLQIGVGFYHHQMAQGEEITFESPVQVYSPCPTANVLQEGHLKVTALNEGIVMDKVAKKGPLFDMYYPGPHLVEALEPSNYLCLSQMPDDMLGVLGLNKPTLTLHTIEETFDGMIDLPANTEYVFPLYGSGVVDGALTIYGRCIALSPGSTQVSVQTEEYLELVFITGQSAE